MALTSQIAFDAKCAVGGRSLAGGGARGRWDEPIRDTRHNRRQESKIKRP